MSCMQARVLLSMQAACRAAHVDAYEICHRIRGCASLAMWSRLLWQQYGLVCRYSLAGYRSLSVTIMKYTEACQPL